MTEVEQMMVHEVEHEGVKAQFREPVGREATQFVRAFRAIPQAPDVPEGAVLTAEQEQQSEEFLYALSDLIHDWMPRLVVEPVECKGDADQCWVLYKRLGRATGPLVQLFTTLVGESLMIPPGQLDDLPFRRREGDGPTLGVTDTL